MFGELIGVAVDGMPLVLVLIALVEWLKKIGLKGEPAINAVAMALGLVFGIGYKFSVAPLITFADWFVAAIFGIVLGLSSIGLYKTGESIVASKE